MTLQAQIDAANAYEALFVPALFRQWAGKVADTAGIRPGQRVLDVACGTGVLAQEALSRTGSSGRVAGLDPNPGMLAVAEAMAPGVDWINGSAESLPFEDQAFDAVVSQFGLMFFDDREQSLREMLRVLVPGGRLTLAVWDSLDNVPAYADEVELIERHAGQRAGDAMRVIFSLGNRDELETLFRDAGVDSVQVGTHPGTARFPGIRTMVEADLRGWLPVMGVTLAEEQIRRILEQAEDALGPYVNEQGGAVFDLSAHIVGGFKP